MDYRQRKELFEMATSKDFIPKDRFKLGYEIGLRSVAPLMFLYVIYFFVAGPIDTWIISSINVVAILAVATYWAGKKYGLHLNPSFFWACFWRLVVYSILLNIVAVFIVMLLQLAGFRGGEILSIATVLLVPALQMIAIGYAAAPAYWISARYVPVSVIVRSYDEVDPALENVIEHHSNYKEGSWNKKNALPFEESAGFKEDYPEEAGGQVNPE